MEKYTILNQRKELKKKSHGVVRSHYMILFFLTLVIILFGTEFSYIKDSWGENPLFGNKSESTEKDKDDVGSILDSTTVLDEIMEGRLSQGEAVSEQLAGQIQEKGDTSKVLGRTRGVLSQIVNMVSSGQFYSSIARTLFTIVKSESAVGVIFTLISFLWYIFIYFVLKNMLSVIYRRILILVRVYENISPADLLHFAAVRKWFRAAWVMFVTDIYSVLWSLTIVGGFIKMYSYFAVPYIIAENPDIKAKEAITLSRKMMNGHKMELFL